MITPGTLPDSITKLTFKHDDPRARSLFNKPLLPGSLPASLTKLRLSSSFDQVLEPGVLPASLTSLTFGLGYVTKLVDGSLPHALTDLRLSNWYHHTLPHVPLLKSLKMSYASHSSVIPDGLETLVTLMLEGTSYNTLNNLLKPWPRTLTKIILYRPYQNMPTLPPSLTSLVCFEVPDARVLAGATSLTHLKAHYQTSLLRPGDLPQSLTSLSLNIRTAINRITCSLLPSSLTSLKLCCEDGLVRVVEPDALAPLTSLRSLVLDLNKEPILGALPPSLTSLILGKRHIHPLTNVILPDSITNLQLLNPEVDWLYPHPPMRLPSKLRHLTCSTTKLYAPLPTTVPDTLSAHVTEWPTGVSLNISTDVLPFDTVTMASAGRVCQAIYTNRFSVRQYLWKRYLLVAPNIQTFRINVTLAGIKYPYFMRRMDQTYIIVVSGSCPSSHVQIIKFD
ncbi:hypothetical protein SAMD00019534_012830 [Acytostelium subglobosum LB1]|uniref:hypothetical protein n=1 Tax=Acytostelium subglobosum LB1 TaxID=1410327 RepID=UPI00064497E2|nr:hypothetical protein SAMD00019534_012830 [Acytostelium subglobosum LB1]GAM18108.1 hypothetical protein SAMD00019534_012830 [Acytostelium subglobosum LB1]|eukprot:XP_012758704.1 hypothetical protein SAMD00019534_012830 [Acytostelium subglobosum LB1]